MYILKNITHLTGDGKDIVVKNVTLKCNQNMLLSSNDIDSTIKKLEKEKKISLSYIERKDANVIKSNMKKEIVKETKKEAAIKPAKKRGEVPTSSKMETIKDIEIKKDVIKESSIQLKNNESVDLIEKDSNVIDTDEDSIEIKKSKRK